MSFDWSQLHEVAKNILKISETNSEKEAYYRSAINRVYYGIYNKLLLFSKDTGYIIKTGEDAGKNHKGIITHFINSKNPKLIDIGTKLQRIQYVRVKADYIAEEEILIGTVNATLKNCDIIHKSMEQ